MLATIQFIETDYNLGLTFITLAFLYLFYVAMYTRETVIIPKPFFLLYGVGGFLLIIKNISDEHIYITINEIIGCFIAFFLYFKI